MTLFLLYVIDAGFLSLLVSFCCYWSSRLRFCIEFRICMDSFNNSSIVADVSVRSVNSFYFRFAFSNAGFETALLTYFYRFNRFNIAHGVVTLRYKIFLQFVCISTGRK